MNTALLVIDAQHSFAARDSWIASEAAPYLKAQQKLVDECQALGVPVVQIFHVEPEGVFALNSGHVRAVDGLNISPDVIFHKHRHSALVGTDLEIWPRERDIGHLIISGIRTEQCCETTTRHASDLGFRVDYVTEATHTMALTHEGSGITLSVADLKMRTEAVLAGRFATIHTVDSVITKLNSGTKQTTRK